MHQAHTLKVSVVTILLIVSTLRPTIAIDLSNSPSSFPLSADNGLASRSKFSDATHFAQAQTTPTGAVTGGGLTAPSDSAINCDKYAASEFDPNRKSGPVQFDKVDPKVAIPACEEADQQFPNDARITFQLGRAYQKAEKYSEALAFYQKAANQNFALAQNNIAVMYQNGWGVPKDIGVAIDWFRKAADQNLAPAEYSLAVMYVNGSGVPKNLETAFVWYKKAADQNYAAAQSDLGAMYQNGWGVQKDSGTAVLWYKKAADQNIALAEINLGVMFQNGLGVQKDLGAAVLWYKKAADQNIPLAETDMGVMYQNGWGVVPNLATALVWFQKAADQDFPIAEYFVGQFYENGFGGLRKDSDKAVYWYRKAANQNVTGAENDLGVMYMNGTEIKKDNKQAATLFRKAAKQGLLLARINLGVVYGAAPEARDPEDLGIILRELAKNSERGSPQGLMGGKLTWEGRSDVEKVQVGKQLLADVEDAAVLESCGLRPNVESRAVAAVKDCIEEDSLKRLATFFRNEKSALQASFSGNTTFCNAANESRAAERLDNEISTWSRMCRSCIMCGR